MPLKNNITTFSLVVIGITGVFSIGEIPIAAQYGLSSVVYYLITGLLFFVPSALVCAELASGWPKAGGIYAWIKEAFGIKIGLFAMWIEWLNNLIAFPVILAFIVITISYVTFPLLQSNKYYMLLAMLIIFWTLTIINFLGIRVSSWINNISMVLGAFLPCLLVIFSGVLFYVSNQGISAQHALKFATPQNIHYYSLLTSLVLSYTGIQVIAFHTKDIEDPEKVYPKAILIITAILLVLSIFSSLAVAYVIPNNNIDIIVGLIQAMQAFFTKLHLRGIVTPIILFIALGRIGALNVWIVGPAKGMLAIANDINVPNVIRFRNRYDAPITILTIQAVITTILSSAYLFMPTVASAYWLLIVMSTGLTLILYMLMFSSIIYLRYKQPFVQRTYQLPGGKVGVWLIAGIGFSISLMVFLLSFIPPAQLNIKGNFFNLVYAGALFIIFIFFYLFIRNTKVKINQ